jgi:hypothetical protein
MNLTNLDLLCIQVPYETIFVTFFLPVLHISSKEITFLLPFVQTDPPPMELKMITSYNAVVTTYAVLTLDNGPMHVFVDRGSNHPEEQNLLGTFSLHTSTDRIVIRLNGHLMSPPPFRISLPSDAEDLNSFGVAHADFLFVHSATSYTYLHYVVFESSVLMYPEGSVPNEIIGLPCSFAIHTVSIK